MPYTPNYAAGDVLTAAQMNSIGEAWTAYGSSSSLTGSTTNPTGTFTMASRYNRINKNIIVNGKFSFGAVTGVGTGTYYYLDVPVTMHSSNTIGMTIGVCAFYDASAVSESAGIVQVHSTSKVRFFLFLTDFFGPNAPTIAAGDELKFHFVYEAA